MTRLRALVLLCLVAVLPMAWAVQPEPSPSSQRDQIEDLPIISLRARLEALTPSDPLAYYRLGEEVAAEATTTPQRQLAQTLFVLAFELDRRAGGLHGASIALALADLSRLEQDRRWLRALARSIDPRYAQPDWGASTADQIPPALAYRAATVLGQIRAGRGSRVRDELDEPQVLDLFQRYESLLSPHGEPGALQILRRQGENWPCPECGNSRIVRKANTVPREDILCHTCHGDPGPRLTSEELIAHLRFEARLLDGIAGSWSAQIAADGGAPLRDPDPLELAPTLGVDPRRTLWRDGRWVAPGEVTDDQS